MNLLFDNSDFEVPKSLIITSLNVLCDDVESQDEWGELFSDFARKQEFIELNQFLISEYSAHLCFPKPNQIFRAFKLTPFKDVKVVVIGQDPYHGVGQADGLAFSVPKGVKTPPSLRNILKELEDDIGGKRSTDLSSLAREGVLLLNTSLSVRNSEAGSHRGKGWEVLIELTLQNLNSHSSGICFVLWGKDAAKLEDLINTTKHRVIKSAHPSPLSAYRGFFGSKPFSNVNNALRELGRDEINWLM